MNESVDFSVAPPRTPEQLAGLKNVTMVVYALMALGHLTGGLSALVAIIINYVKRDDVRGTIYESHFDWQIRTFWWGLLWMVVGFILVFVLVGFVVLAAAYIWTIYRVIKGWIKLNEGKPVFPA
jgi:uncharacterized membrane protein